MLCTSLSISQAADFRAVMSCSTASESVASPTLSFHIGGLLHASPISCSLFRLSLPPLPTKVDSEKRRFHLVRQVHQKVVFFEDTGYVTELGGSWAAAGRGLVAARKI
jgi:hypothetical protein